MAWGLPSTESLVRFCQKLNRLKTVEEPTGETLPQRHLTTLDLTLLGVGGMVGFGLYVLTGTVAKDMAGPAVLVSFSVAAVAALLAALCYAELGASVRGKSSAYLFTYVSMGELWAFLIGWNTLLGCLIGGAAVARAWSGYLDTIFSYRIRSFTVAHVGIWWVPFLAQYPDFLAAAITLLTSTIVSCGARVTYRLNRIFSAISLVVILFIIILGFVLARPHNWGAEEGGFAPLGFSGIMAGAATYRPTASPALPLSPQVPLVPLTPALSILLNIFLMLYLSHLTWLGFSIWLLVGLLVYFGYGIRHSKENQRERPGLTAPRGSLEETVQALQTPSQALAQKPGHTE
ncbi:PREDICTED: cationic amino acid transporter 4-like [Ceratotherium simum simum]|uniref:Cationic amino acid transporter 4-like n=1 Tax=Ceratotherium simum simum TaxID=73337 RepID=A0ABM1C739_CERSS|nr:PREDICTED: cationic amino acid transporter 4-like [Ceratotherium simum simum]